MLFTVSFRPRAQPAWRNLKKQINRQEISPFAHCIRSVEMTMGGGKVAQFRFPKGSPPQSSGGFAASHEMMLVYEIVFCSV